MVSVVDICNLALSHIGDTATVASIDPPEGSIQAEHCKRFYPVARDSLLEMHEWKFSSKHKILSLYKDSEYPQWSYAYSLPPDFIKAVAVTKECASHQDIMKPREILADYAIELDSENNLVLYTQIENAFLRYQARVLDSTKYSPLFVTTLSWYLSSLLAGVVVKGDEGFKQSQRCLETFSSFLSQATCSDAQQRKSSVLDNYGSFEAYR